MTGGVRREKKILLNLGCDTPTILTNTEAAGGVSVHICAAKERQGTNFLVADHIKTVGPFLPNTEVKPVFCD
jgi:hypothetical protein